MLHKKIFGDDDDDEEEDEEKDEDDGPGHPVTFREDERLPIPGIPQTYDHVKPEDDAVDAAHEAEPERVHPRKQPALRRIKREAPALAPAPVPAPAPAPAAKKQRVAISATNDHKQFFTDDEWRALGVDILTKYQAAKVTYKTNKYDAENTPILNAQAPLYHIKTQRRADGKSAELPERHPPPWTQMRRGVRWEVLLADAESARRASVVGEKRSSVCLGAAA